MADVEFMHLPRRDNLGCRRKAHEFADFQRIDVDFEDSREQNAP
jgi:hypothetical protein